MPIPAGNKTYKRKTGDPEGKIYSDEGTYGDERDDLWARGKSHTSDETDLFDMFCRKMSGRSSIHVLPSEKDNKR